MGDDLLQMSDAGLYCPAGDFHIDPWKPVARAVLTHAHADHARLGSDRYLAAAAGARLLRTRLASDIQLDELAYGESVTHNGVRISLHPAGHVLGSAQVRIEWNGRICVVTGDYKLASDPTCAPFEPVRCHRLVTESTFGLPIYRWPTSEQIFADLNAWWRENAESGRSSLVFCYALGKAQRLLAGLDPAIGPIVLHGATARLTDDYRAIGVALPATYRVSEAPAGIEWNRALVLAPPSAQGTPWMKRFGTHATAFASGWMRIRGTRRRRTLDRGFVLSDHADWPGLLAAIASSNAEEVWVTHGYVAVLVRYLCDRGMNAIALETRFQGERIEGEASDNVEENS